MCGSEDENEGGGLVGELGQPSADRGVIVGLAGVEVELVPAFRRETATIAAIVMVTDSSRNSCSVTRRTGMPTSRAASGLPPIA